MRGRQIRPAKVMQTAREELRKDFMGNASHYRPPWFHVVSSIPPSETLVRTIPPQLGKPVRSTKGWTSRNLYRPQQIVYIEDTLRSTFYKDHPWELARPRIILESDGKDASRCDWSTGLRQPGIALTGECVVQHQLWLMESKGMTQQKAYDIARREFYKLRHAEEIERRIAVEEARYVGAYFGRTKNEAGMMLEDRSYEHWKVWATAEIKARALRESTNAMEAGNADALPEEPDIIPPDDSDKDIPVQQDSAPPPSPPVAT